MENTAATRRFGGPRTAIALSIAAAAALASTLMPLVQAGADDDVIQVPLEAVGYE